MFVCLHALSRVQLLQPPGLQPARRLCPQDSPGKKTGVVCHFFFQGIFPAEGSNPRLLRLLRLLTGGFFTTAPPGKPTSARVLVQIIQKKIKKKMKAA